MNTNVDIKNIAWIDCEMTGLDLKKDILIEIALLVTDQDLRPIDKGINVIIKPQININSKMNRYVYNMHKSSGLLNELKTGISIKEAENILKKYIVKHTCNLNNIKIPLAGSSISIDKSFIERDMPRLINFFHYRIIDVSTIKELAKRWFFNMYNSLPKKHVTHRALFDIYDSINELKFYRKILFNNS